ncbi:MAG TPA: amidohydrolase family protein [Syntrophorhabdales bacterium]|nr:amidohydrolase family protein [Syntrophorhabdales bacterium]
MALVIDGFAHVMPKAFAEALAQVYPTDELRKLTQHSYFGDMENRVRVMDKFRLDKQVLTLARPSIFIGIAPDAVPEMTRQANDAVAAVANQFPDRFIAVGTLPIPSEDYLNEFDRCVNELGMAGIQILTNVEGKRLHAPEFRPFFAHANATKTPIWIHPQLVAGWSDEFALDKIFGWLYETSITLAQLVFSGIMEDYPDLRIIPHHMGAMVPHNSGRLKGFYEARDLYPGTGFVTLPREPLEYFRRFYGDTMLCGTVHAFESGYKFFGPEHIIMATDYPFGPKQGEQWIKETLDQIDAIGLPPAEKDLILSGNLLRLIRRE